MLENITTQAVEAIEELLQVASPNPESIVVIGCSTSEVSGGVIGKNSSPDIAAAILRGLLPSIESRNLFLAAQCCEHLNRALIVERHVAEKFGYEPVCVVPQPKAGGSFATVVWDAMKDPVAVEHIKAAVGLDIGETLIGMHLKDVAVPVRLKSNFIGNARLTAARTRPKFIGGARAIYG